jgi:NADP-dependent 3-hydroxy acid dehydrogenase YdfG
LPPFDREAAAVVGDHRFDWRQKQMTKVCAILGVGPGNGRSFARKFSAGGYKVALCARTEPHINDEVRAIGDTARGYVMDVTDDRSVQDGFAAITQKQGPADTLIYNAGTAVWGNVDKIAPADLLPGFDVNAAGLIRAVQATLPAMRKAGRGNIIVVGAGAALRGRPDTLGFAAAKAAQRSVCQSLARQLGPEGIHVSLLILDGVIDIKTTMKRMNDKPRDFFLTADGVADAAFALTEQDRQAWTFELDLRPYGESW